jgi:hypothetical protein
MATGSCQGIMKSIATTEILPWLQLAAVVIGGKNGAGALHTRIRPFSVRRINKQPFQTFIMGTTGESTPSQLAMYRNEHVHIGLGCYV